MKFRCYAFPLLIFAVNIFLLSLLLIEISGIKQVNQGGLGFIVPFLSFLSFLYIRAQQRRRCQVSRGLSILQMINAITFILPFIILIVFIIRIL
ncbi:hypothetical protein [Halobacillus massiliensis]|uniref:hypothetical protein n=1 Tax=Halobacillus massiliensis TaxID=1926286 RepID=UPI0009E38926|nr:hypothetical protein [Halobacillus massiliensis]